MSESGNGRRFVPMQWLEFAQSGTIWDLDSNLDRTYMTVSHPMVGFLLPFATLSLPFNTICLT
jgi:hypothetical protein